MCNLLMVRFMQRNVLSQKRPILLHHVTQSQLIKKCFWLYALICFVAMFIICVDNI